MSILERESRGEKMMVRKGGGGGGRAGKKEEKLGEKLRRGVLVGERGGPCTPVVSSWRLFSLPLSNSDTHHPTLIKLHPLSQPSIFPSSSSDHFHLHHHHPRPPPVVSVRKLAAALWELQHYLPLAKMHRGAHANGGGAGAGGGGGGAGTAGAGANGGPPPRLRNLHHRHHSHHQLHRDKALDLSNFLADNSPTSSDQVFINLLIYLSIDSWFFFPFGYCLILILVLFLKRKFFFFFWCVCKP